jgi:hypothetical protein
MQIQKDLREFVELLNSNEVEYLVVGAFAVAYWSGLRQIMRNTSISGVSFNEAWASREGGELSGVPALFIGREALLRNKESTGRTKDLGDAEELRKRSPG